MRRQATIRYLYHSATTAILTPHCSATRRLLVTDHVVLNHGQVVWTTPKLALPLLTTTPRQWEDVQLSTDLTCIDALHGGSLMSPSHGGYDPWLVTEWVRVRIPSKTWLYLLREGSRSFA
ncbi:hypothetical protein TNCV_3366511 [Trichonephila clavipes]|nr:hypothetical protein TNCV_3366511 [Trichonephila clavipes]